jgi:hypothetical protein
MIGSLKKFPDAQKRSSEQISISASASPLLAQITTWTCVNVSRIPDSFGGHIVFKAE